MVQAIPFVAAWVVSAGAIGAATVAILNTILVNVALGAISKALTKKPRVEAPPVNVSVRNPVENRRLVWGTVRVGGVFAFYDVSGDNNKYLWYVIAVAGHQVERIKDVWLDTHRIAEGSIGSGAVGGGSVPSGTFGGKLWIYKHLGTSSQTVDSELQQAISTWTVNHRLKGIAYIVVKMERDDEKYPQGAPNHVTALVDGALVYDPRLDSTNGGSGTHRRDNPSTWGFGSGALAIGRNPALIWRWFTAGGSVHNNMASRLVKYGLKDDSRINDLYTAQAANDCDDMLTGTVAPPSGDQPRYRCDLEVSTGETRRDIIEDILATMAGAHICVHGEHRVYAGVYNESVHSFTELDLYGQLEIEDTVDHHRRYNAVAGIFRNAASDYVEQSTIFRTDEDYEAQDGDERIPIEIDLRGVTDQYQAQRLCEIKLRKSRMMRSVKLVGALNLMGVCQYETLTYSHARYGWGIRTFRCLEKQFEFFEDAGRVALTCQREDAAVYADMLTADYTTGTSDTDVFQNETPDPPTGLKTTPQQNGYLAEWTAPAIVFPGTTFAIRQSTASDMSANLVTVYAGPDLQAFVKRNSTVKRYIQVRSERNGEVSAWHPVNAGVVAQAASVQTVLSADADPGEATSATGAANQTTAAVLISPIGGTSPYTYAWTWLSGGASITITSASSASTTFSTTGLTSGQTRSGIARCTVMDNVSATFTVDVPVEISRPAAVVTAPAMNLESMTITPSDASVAFKIDADGHWYTSESTASPALDRGLWCSPADYAADYQVRVTRTAGASAFTSGTMNTWQTMSTDREWRLTEATNGTAVTTITFTIQFRRVSDSVVVSTQTGNVCRAQVEPDTAPP